MNLTCAILLSDFRKFQEIFVINLPRRTDRKDVMTLAAAFSKLKLSWINGVSGKDVSCKRSKYNYHSLLILGIG